MNVRKQNVENGLSSVLLQPSKKFLSLIGEFSVVNSYGNFTQPYFKL